MAPRNMPTQTGSTAQSRAPLSSSSTGSISATTLARLNTALAYYPGREIPILYDATLPPSVASGKDTSPAQLSICLAQEAILPSPPCIVLENQALGCKTTVHPCTTVGITSPSPSWFTSLPDLLSPPLPHHPPPVTIHDVLLAIHRAVHARLSYDEFNFLELTLQDAVIAAWQARCSTQDNIRRMDLLAAAGFGTQVAGLSASRQGGQIWELHFLPHRPPSQSSPRSQGTHGVRGRPNIRVLHSHPRMRGIDQ